MHNVQQVQFCTPGFETGCMSYGNNAWNDAQAMLFAGTFGVNVLDSSSGYTKNGNNILDAFFDLVDVDGVFDGSIHGFTNYDVPQIARGLDAFIRQYRKNIQLLGIYRRNCSNKKS